MADPTKDELRSTEGHTAEDLALERSETVCKFCGVSYLIFSEVKALEKKLKEATAKAQKLEKQVEKEKAEVKKAFTTFQVDALEQKQKHEEATKALEEKLSHLKAQLEAAKSNTSDAIAAALKEEAKKAQAEVQAQMNRSQRQLLVEINHKADLRSYLKQLPHYLSSVRRLQHERDHLQSLLSDLTHVVATEIQSVNEGVGRMSKAMQDAQDGVESTRRELNAQLKVEVEKLNGKSREHAARVKDLENQVQMLQASLVEQRKVVAETEAKFAVETDKVMTAKVLELRQASENFAAKTKHHQMMHERALTKLKEEVEIAKSEAQQLKGKLEDAETTSARRMQQAVEAEKHANTAGDELTAAIAKLKTLQDEFDAFKTKAGNDKAQLQNQIDALQGSASEREAHLQEALKVAEEQASEQAKRAASWQSTVEDSAKVHAAELASRDAREEAAAQEAAKVIAELRRELNQLEGSGEQVQAEAQSMLAKERAALEKQTIQEVEAATQQLQQEHERAFAAAQEATEKEIAGLHRELATAKMQARRVEVVSNELQQAEQQKKELVTRVEALERDVASTQASTASAANSASQSELAELNEMLEKMQGLIADRDREIERLEDIVHRECLERTDLLARLRELEQV